MAILYCLLSIIASETKSRRGIAEIVETKLSSWLVLGRVDLPAVKLLASNWTLQKRTGP